MASKRDSKVTPLTAAKPLPGIQASCHDKCDETMEGIGSLRCLLTRVGSQLLQWNHHMMDNLLRELLETPISLNMLTRKAQAGAEISGSMSHLWFQAQFKK